MQVDVCVRLPEIIQGERVGGRSSVTASTADV
jgi:hypothetical protein